MKTSMPLLFLTLTLAACAQKGPGCSDADTLDLVRQVFQKSVTDAAAKKRLDAEITGALVSGIKMAVTGIRTTAMDEKTRKHQCVAQLEINLHPKTAAAANHPLMQAAIQVESGPHPMRFEQERMIASVHYEVQPSDDGKTLHLSLGGHAGAVSVIVELDGLRLVQEREAHQPKSSTEGAKPLLANKPEALAGLEARELLDKEPALDARLKDMLEKDYERLMQRLEVSPGARVEGEYLVLQGNAPSQGDQEEAAFAVQPAKGQVYVVILSEGKLEITGTKTARNLPEPLYRWYQERGGQN